MPLNIEKLKLLDPGEKIYKFYSEFKKEKVGSCRKRGCRDR